MVPLSLPNHHRLLEPAMTQATFRLNIFHKLLMTMLVVALVPLGIVWYVGSSQLASDTNQNISQQLMMTANTLATEIDGWDEGNIRALRTAARYEDIISMDPAKQTPILRAMNDIYDWAFVVFTVEPAGDNIARSDDKPLTKFGDRTYFKQSMAGEMSARQVLISKSTGKPALTLAVPIKDSLGSPVGVLAMAMKLDDISKVIKDTRIGLTGYAILLDADKKVIASGRPDMSKDSLQDLSTYAALKIDGITDAPMTYDAAGKKLVGYVRKMPQGWTLLVEQEYSEAYAALERLEKGARILLLLTATFVLLAASFLGKQFTRPINQLIVVAEQLSTGNFGEDVPGTRRGDEIGALARAVERLGVSIRMAMERIRRKA